MATRHVVQQGEHLGSIAQTYGFRNPMTIWNHPDNTSLRSVRENPNVLLPGDELVIPDKQARFQTVITGRRHHFKLTAPKLHLRIQILAPLGAPLASAKCALEVEGTNHTLLTDIEGKLEVETRWAVQAGCLSVQASASQAPVLPLKTPLEIGHLDPIQTPSGQKARLDNMGYLALEDDASDQATRIAIEDFQCDHGLSVDGVCGPKTQAALLKAHGS